MWLNQLMTWTRESVPCALLTVIDASGSTPRSAGAKMVVDEQGRTADTIGGGSMEHVCMKQAQTAIRENRCLTLRFCMQGAEWRVTEADTILQHCGGEMTVFIEPHLPGPEVVLFGGGHVAENVARFLDILDISYRIYDNRPEFACADRYPGAQTCIAAPYERIAEHIKLTQSSYCVILTHGHEFDEVCLEQLMQNAEIPYVGMIGSAKKVRVLVDRIRVRGVEMDDRFYSPVGLDIGRRLPAEIALSIVAELVLLMRCGKPTHCRRDWKAAGKM